MTIRPRHALAIIPRLGLLVMVAAMASACSGGSATSGDSVAEVLSYCEYNPKELADRFRALAESAVVSKRITPSERKEIMGAFEAGLRGYTYFET